MDFKGNTVRGLQIGVNNLLKRTGLDSKKKLGQLGNLLFKELSLSCKLVMA
jgi:hypothetical protein